MRAASLLLLLLTAIRLPAETLVCLGDSITAGYGLTPEQAWPALVQESLAAEPATAGWKVVNAGVSGDTTAGARRRIAWVLKQKPAFVLIALGGNDGLRNLPVADMEANLRAIAEACRAAGARIAFAGMRMPANLGPEYRAAFEQVHPRLAAEFSAPLLPFLLEGVALKPELNQADQIHPNAEGQRAIAARVTAFLRPLLTGPAAQ